MREYNMNNHRKEKSRVFSGREEGKILRNKLELDNIDLDKSEAVKIIFPEDTISLNSSFFLGLFGPSVRTLGKELFVEKYQFEVSNTISKNVDDGIKRALKTSNPLDRA